jgi:hydrophobic/amphiphilic exporter-1 (mainly G- bacteria), HAE1 family
VVFVFLQNWRATLIPLLTVPVSLVGAFIFFPLLGFSVNVLSLLGLVLAIGIVVDDAIVVVEAVMHHIEHGMEPKEATSRRWKRCRAGRGHRLILAAVFVPVGFMGGITGRLYQQFAITIAISVLLSAFNALTLSPRARGPAAEAAARQEELLTPFYDGFNRVFGRGTDAYVSFSGILIRKMAAAWHSSSSWWRDRGAGAAHPGRLRARGGPGLPAGQRPAPGRQSLQRTDAVMKQGRGDPRRPDGVEAYNTSPATACSPAPTPRTWASSSSS